MKLKSLAALAMCAAVSIGTFGVAACGEQAHEHNLTATAAAAATCTTQGNKAYWYCSGCDKYFSDENATTEITLDSTVIAATGHTYEYKHDDTNHWQECSVCHDKTAETAHTYENGECSVCGAEDPAANKSGTYGITFSLATSNDITFYVNGVESAEYKQSYLDQDERKMTFTFNSDGTAVYTYSAEGENYSGSYSISFNYTTEACTSLGFDYANESRGMSYSDSVEFTGYKLVFSDIQYIEYTYNSQDMLSSVTNDAAEDDMLRFGIGYNDSGYFIYMFIGYSSSGSEYTYRTMYSDFIEVTA